MTFEEKTRLFKTAAQKPDWETAYLVATLAVSTTARGCELRALQWPNVDFIDRKLEIPKSKTAAGVRIVPLTQEAYEALLKFHRRAQLFGPVEPTHYVLAAFQPKFELEHDEAGKLTPKGMTLAHFDPTRPVGSWCTAWRTLTKKAELPGLRFHDLRTSALGGSGSARQGGYGHCRTRQHEDAAALFPYSA